MIGSCRRETLTRYRLENNRRWNSHGIKDQLKMLAVRINSIVPLSISVQRFKHCSALNTNSKRRQAPSYRQGKLKTIRSINPKLPRILLFSLLRVLNQLVKQGVESRWPDVGIRIIPPTMSCLRGLQRQRELIFTGLVFSPPSPDRPSQPYSVMKNRSWTVSHDGSTSLCYTGNEQMLHLMHSAPSLKMC